MTAVARRALSTLVHFFSSETWGRHATQPKESASPLEAEPDHRVGEYYADYSEVTIAELTQPQPELDQLFKDSKIVSAKRES